MKLTNFFSIVAACAAGFLGGTLAPRARVEAVSVPVVRASRFELVDAAGRAIARWETDPEHKSIHLCFLGKSGVSLDLGVFPDAGPFVRIYGRDGKSRISMSLDGNDKPGFGMSDERWLGRVVLGHWATDTPDIPDSTDRWGLAFRPFGTTRAAAYIGMANAQGGQTEGVLSVNGERVR